VSRRGRGKTRRCKMSRAEPERRSGHPRKDDPTKEAESGHPRKDDPTRAAESGHPQKDDPTKAGATQTRESIHVLTSIEFLQGNVKVYESKQVAATEVTAPDRKAVVFQIDLPLQSLKPGLYVCQVNVIDDVAGNFAFPRWPILIKDAAPAAAPATQSSSSSLH
jgi:hypothetical protein